ncbi:hypothetical protein ABVT39_022745, partial [Epinephelus coioides]
MSAGGVPRVIVFGFWNYHYYGKRRTAQCKTCGINISDNFKLCLSFEEPFCP